MYIVAVKLTRAFFWGAIVAGILMLLFPQWVPWWIPAGLAIACAGWFSIAAVHIWMTRRREYRCPICGWVPFGLEVWKCKECGFVWDSFSTAGICPRCRHEHEETACVRCRKISKNDAWRDLTDSETRLSNP
jgi:hypothetical protein